MNDLGQPNFLALQRRALNSLPLLGRLRLQIPLVVFVSAMLPAILIGDWQFWNPFAFSAVSNAFYSVLASGLIALMLFRRLGSFPGITSLGLVSQAVVLPYLATYLAIISTRLEYSRPVLLISSFLAASLFFGLWRYLKRRCLPAIYAIPGAKLSVGHLKVRNANLEIEPDRLDRNPVIVVNLSADLPQSWQDYLLKAALAGVPVYHEKHLQESLLGRVEVEHLSENSFGSVNPNQVYSRLKRVVDILCCLAAFPVLIPLFLCTAFLIKIDSPGPVLFIQTRMGLGGRPFGVCKFRTMRLESSKNTCRDAARTMDEDPRITRVGRVLRRYRIDELPQVINILRGEMSWIGPRPEAIALVTWYQGEIPFYGYRHMVRPGITGWAQVHQGHVHDLDEIKRKLQYDFYYIKYFSWWLDALVAFRTIKTILVGNGAR